MELIQPNQKYKESFIQALYEYQKEGGYPTVNIEHRRKNFGAYLERLENESKGIYKDTKQSRVPMFQLWLIDNESYIGTSLLRPKIEGDLFNRGGHISYEIRPSERRKGYGKKILALTLLKAKEHGLEKVLLTCDESNIASKKIIEHNGGIADTPFFEKGMSEQKLRYWINIST